MEEPTGMLAEGGDVVDPAVQGRHAFEQKSWREAFMQLAAADQENPLGAEDLERLAIAAYLTGRNAESTEAWSRAHQAFLGQEQVERAARCAFWLALELLNRGEEARAGGWLARARRIINALERECVEQGYLLLPEALKSIFGGDNAAAFATFGTAAEIGDRFKDRDLAALARHGQGRALLRMGEVREGVALLDEALAGVEAGEVSPLAAGDVYCSVIEGCLEVFDLRRAREWTAALTRWCDSQAGLIPYRGQCLARRAEILQVNGDWSEAMNEVQRACEWLLGPPPQRAAGAALYEQAELHRLRGEFAEAEEAYRQASHWGVTPEPGLALLRRTQGDIAASEAAIRRAMDEARDRRRRARLLPAYVEIMLAANEIGAAAAATAELVEIAEAFDAPFLRTVADYANGAVHLAQGDANAALPFLRRAWTGWQAIGAPYEAARARVLIGIACRELGDQEAAEMDFAAARAVFQSLGAEPDVDWVESLAARRVPGAAHGLTPREIQVLRLVAAGETNRAVAGQLFISERTVERHVSNIFNKIGVGSRAAATAYAYEHQLV